MSEHERIDTAEKPGRLMDLMHSTTVVARKCLAIQPGQSVLIVTDTEVSPMVYHAMAAAVHIAGGIPLVAIMRPLEHANAEPPNTIGAAMKEADITIAMVSRTITHTRAREIATQEHKRRYLLIPAVTEDMLMRGASTADFDVVKEITMGTAKALSRGKQVRVTSEHGTDLVFSVEGRPFRAYFGECIKPGDVSLFPGGEANTLPVEETINGTVVYDSFMMGVGLLVNPITVEFERGRATAIRGGREADTLKRILDGTKSEDSFRFGEFAVGTNYRARTIGNAFEDKQVYGTVHIALGSGVAWPKYYKPNYHAPIHLDGVLSSPTISVDGAVAVTGRRVLVAPKPPEE
ncbi:MAG: aminopeptidase [Betaproteobacteria bacterium]|nr:aminopeptidase [Betaproteobacteria bacterium]